MSPPIPANASVEPVTCPAPVAELFPDQCMGTGRACGNLGNSARHGGQADMVPGPQGFQQHPLPMPHPLRTADHPFHGNEHVPATVGCTLKRGSGHSAATAHGHALGIGRDHHAGNAEITGFTQVAFRVMGPERQPDQGGHRPEGDVLAHPVDPEPKHIRAVVLPPAHDAHAGHAFDIGGRPRQAEDGDFLPARQARQVFALLRLGAVAMQQVGGPRQVRRHDRDCRGTAAGGQLLQDAGPCKGGKTETAILRRRTETEKCPVPDVEPHLRRQVVGAMHDSPVDAHGTQFLHRALDEFPLGPVQPGCGDVHQPSPVRTPAEQARLPSGRSGIYGLPFNGRQLRNEGFHPVTQRPGHPATPDTRGEIQEHQHRSHDKGGQQRQHSVGEARHRPQQHGQRRHRQPDPRRHLPNHEDGTEQDQQQEVGDHGNAVLAGRQPGPALSHRRESPQRPAGSAIQSGRDTPHPG